MPGVCVTHKVILFSEKRKRLDGGDHAGQEAGRTDLWEHPCATCLGREATVVHEENEVSSLSVATFTELKLRLVQWRDWMIAVETELDGHPARLREKQIRK
jgi:hypothetical protein